ARNRRPPPRRGRPAARRRCSARAAGSVAAPRRGCRGRGATRSGRCWCGRARRTQPRRARRRPAPSPPAPGPRRRASCCHYRFDTIRHMANEIDALLQENRTFAPPADFRRNANANDESVYDIKDREAYWANWASQLDWQTKWSKVLDWDPPYAKWFVGG